MQISAPSLHKRAMAPWPVEEERGQTLSFGDQKEHAPQSRDPFPSSTKAPSSVPLWATTVPLECGPPTFTRTISADPPHPPLGLSRIRAVGETEAPAPKGWSQQRLFLQCSLPHTTCTDARGGTGRKDSQGERF